VGRNGRWLLAALALAAPTLADDALADRWDHPRRENFDIRDSSARDVAEAISKRFGVPIRCEDASATDPTAFKVTDVTFFEALDRLAAAQGLSVVGVPASEETREHSQESLALRRPARAHGATPVAYLGPSRLSVQGLAARKTKVFTAEGPRVGTDPVLAAWSDLVEEDRLHVVFKWIVEPGFEDLMLVRMKVAAEDDAGNPLRIVPRFEFVDPPGTVCSDLPLKADRNFSVYFDRPRPEARAIRELTGTVWVALPVERGEIEFRPADAGSAKQLGGCRVTFVEAKDDVLRFAFEGVPCVEISATDLLGRIEIVAYGADGRVVECSKCGGTEGEDRPTWWEEYEGPPARVVLRAITKVALREAPFAFADIPLPE